MDFRIRSAAKSDGPAMLDLIRELAVYENAADEVTVSLQHFEESGFGEKPVWWAFVACVPSEQVARSEAVEAAAQPNVIFQDPLLAQIMEQDPQTGQQRENEPGIMNLSNDAGSGESFIQLSESIIPMLAEEMNSALSAPAGSAPICDKIIGLGLYYIRYSTWKGQRMFLEDIVVTEGWRGKGVGTALMDALIGEAKAAGLHGISWQVLSWNESAIRFYERYGVRFDKDWMNVAIDL